MKLAALKAAPYNPRTISAKAARGLKASIRRFGLVQPIVWNKRTERVVGDHQRIDALKALGTDETQVVVVDLPEGEEKALNVTLNNPAVEGEFSNRIGQVIEEIRLEMPAPAFAELRFDDLLDTCHVDDASVEPPVPTTSGPVVTQRGDKWTLGEHRLLCGDATTDASWAALFGENRASLVFTDPPYGVDYASPSGKHRPIKGDGVAGQDLIALLRATLINAAAFTLDEAAFYIWHASATRQEFTAAMTAAGLKELQYLLWVKPSATLGHDDYQWAHEPCFYAAKAGEKPAFYGDRSQPTVWRFASRAGTAQEDGRAVVVAPGIVVGAGGSALFVTERMPKGRTRSVQLAGDEAVLLRPSSSESTVWEVRRDHMPEHPTQKPVELARRAIANSSRPGEIVADCFAGSGSTIMAAELTGRRGFGLELEPRYCDVVVERWQNLTGQKATRA
jgi:DNA modification methylase